MKNKLEVIEWLIKQRYEGNDELLKSIMILMKESQETFNDDEMLGIYLCGIRWSNDWRQELANYKEMMNKTNTNNI